MGDSNKQVCRLCLVIAPTCECETIEEVKKEKLQVLQINIDFAISNYAVACTRCLKILQDCFDFKSRITTLTDIKETSQREMIGENLCLEKSKVCQLCMSLIKKEAFNYTTHLKDGVFLKDMIRDCFPKVDLNTLLREPLICKHCVSGLQRYYEFMKNCQEVEQRIEGYCGAVSHCTAGEDNLEDILIFKDYNLLNISVIIKRECLDVENADENITRESEEIASIKCEEIDIKDELDIGPEQSGTYQMNDYDNLGEKGTSKGKRKVKRCKPGEQNHICPKCPYSAKLSRSLKKHMRTHSDNKQHSCTFCSFVTDTKSFLQNHMTTHRGTTKKYGCRRCSYETNYKRNLVQHIINHKDISEVEMHKCLLCPFRSKNKASFVSHQKLQHEKTIKLYECQECSFTTKYRSNLQTHQLGHEDPKVAYKFQCEKCPFCSKRQRDLKTHMKIHNKQLHSCDQCTFSSNYPHVLHRHRLVHQTDGQRQMYKCDLCSYQAKLFYSVKAHIMRIHTDPSKLPKFKCAHCPYETSMKDYLSSHIRSQHSRKDQRPFKCELCQFSTWQKVHLQRHQLMIHVEAGDAM